MSIHDLHNITDLITELGEPKIKKRLSPSRILYIWTHYTALVRHHDGEVLKLEDRSITKINSNLGTNQVV